MANVNINVNANTSNANNQLQQVNTTINQIADSTQDANKEQKSWAESVKEIGGSIISNYNNIKGLITDVVGVYTEANKRQLQFKNLIESESYKKYSEQIDNITNSTAGLTSAYEETQTLQKLFASGVDLSGDKLTKLTEVATNYAHKMGVDVTEALQRFSETIAEGSTSKLEDLGIYMDSETAILNYSIATGISAKEVDDLTKKQIILNEILKLTPSGTKVAENGLTEINKTTKEFKQSIDEMIVSLGDTVGTGLMWLWNENYKGSKFWGEKLYDLIHILDEVPETIEGDVIPSTISLNSSVQTLGSTIKKTTDEIINLGVAGIVTFKGIVANNIDAITKLSDTYKKEQAEWKKINQQNEDQKSKEKQMDIELAKWREENEHNRVNKAKRTADELKKIEFDNAKEKYNEMAKKRDENFKIEEDRLKVEEENAKNIADEKLKVEEQYQNAKQRVEEMGVKATADFSAMLINDVLMGEKEFRLSMIGDFVKGIGTQMISDGTFQTLSGLAKGWGGNPLGFEQAKYGAIEVGMGIGMGGVGKIFGGSGSGSSKSDEKVSSQNKTSQSQQSNKIGITTYLYPNATAYYRNTVETSRKISKRKL